MNAAGFFASAMARFIVARMSKPEGKGVEGPAGIDDDVWAAEGPALIEGELWTGAALRSVPHFSQNKALSGFC